MRNAREVDDLIRALFADLSPRTKLAFTRMVVNAIERGISPQQVLDTMERDHPESVASARRLCDRLVTDRKAPPLRH